MLEALAEFTQSLPTWGQWLGVMLISTIPFVESFLGATIGVISGIPPVIAILAAIVGNAASTLAFIQIADRARAHVLAGRTGGTKELTPRRQRIVRMLNRFGVPGVSLVGIWVMPSQFSASILISVGASRRQVIAWQIVAIALWGILFGVLATIGVDVLSLR